jgi:hypothetical protein
VDIAPYGIVTQLLSQTLLKEKPPKKVVGELTNHTIEKMTPVIFRFKP